VNTLGGLSVIIPKFKDSRTGVLMHYEVLLSKPHNRKRNLRIQQ
jgi:hypothetical protein